MSLKLYYNVFSPPSRALAMVLEKLKLKFEKKVVDLMKGEHVSEEFTRLNPQQAIPVLVENDVTFRESRAIMTYLVDKYSPNSPLYPTDRLLRQRVDEALYFDSTHIFASAALLMYYAYTEKRFPEKVLIDLVEKNVNKLEKTLSLPDHKFVAGNELTLGDLSMITTVTSIEKLKIFDFESKVKTREWIENVKAEVENDVSWDEYIDQGGEVLKSMIFEFTKKGIIRN